MISESSDAPNPNALTINKLGHPGKPFPAWVWIEEADQTHVATAGAMRVQDLAPVLVETGAEFTFVFDVETSNHIQDEAGQWTTVSMLEIAHQEKVEVTAADSDCFVVHTTDVARLFEASGQYQVSLLGIGDGTTDLSSLWIRGQDIDWSTTQEVLSRFDKALYFVNVHDDCFVHAEFRTHKLSSRCAARMLWFALATALAEHEVETVVKPPNSTEVDLILGSEGRFISSMTESVIDETSVSLAFMRSDWRIPAEIHHTHWLTYHFNGLWELGERSST